MKIMTDSLTYLSVQSLDLHLTNIFFLISLDTRIIVINVTLQDEHALGRHHFQCFLSYFVLDIESNILTYIKMPSHVVSPPTSISALWVIFSRYWIALFLACYIMTFFLQPNVIAGIE